MLLDRARARPWRHGHPFSEARGGHRVSTDAGRTQTALAGRYAIERELGRGGMATVFLARDLKHDRPVALKVLHPELAAGLGPERFLREIRLAARLQHPHILTVLDSGEAAGQLWFTMPFIEGESLRDRLRRERQLPVEDALRIAREAADALDYAHQHGVDPPGHQAREHPAHRTATRWWPTSASPGRSAAATSSSPRPA